MKLRNWLGFVMLVLLVAFMPMVAFAQGVDAPGLPTGSALGILIGGLVIGAVLMSLRKLAPLTENKIDDQALAILEQAAPMLQKWMDPNDSAVPPSPTNPSGTAS